MTIVYPINETLMLQKASDARIMRMSAHFAAQGHKVYLIVGRAQASRKEILEYYGLDDLPNLQILQVPILRKNNRLGVSWNGVLYLFALIELIRLSRREKIDVLYLSVFKLASFLLAWRRWFRVGRVVYELHELGIYPETAAPGRSQIRLDRIERKILPKMDGVITTTRTLQAVLKERFPGLPVSAIPLGTKASRSASPPYRFIGKSVYHVCYIGQLYPAQGVDLLLEACAGIAQARLHIIGGKEKEVSELRSLAKRWGMEERVVFHGFTPPGEVQKLISGMDIFTLPARNTVRMNYVAHIKIYEYMSYGRPIVATLLDSTREELRDGENAILVKPDDPSALADGIKRLIEDPPLAQKILERALQEAPLYHWENRIVRIQEFIARLPQKG